MLITPQEMINIIQKANRFKRPYIRVKDRKEHTYVVGSNIPGKTPSPLLTVIARPRVYSTTWSRWKFSHSIPEIKRAFGLEETQKCQ